MELRYEAARAAGPFFGCQHLWVDVSTQRRSGLFNDRAQQVDVRVPDDEQVDVLRLSPGLASVTSATSTHSASPQPVDTRAWTNSQRWTTPMPTPRRASWRRRNRIPPNSPRSPKMHTTRWSSPPPPELPRTRWSAQLHLLPGSTHPDPLALHHPHAGSRVTDLDDETPQISIL